jgi:hypothetical protein
MALDPNFKEFIELLNANGVEYLVIGGFAVNFHGYPRYTKDIDFWIWMTEENIDRVMTAIEAFGFGSLGLRADDFLSPDAIIQLGYEPYRIDLLMSVDGVDFPVCYDRRTQAEVDGTIVNFLSLTDLIVAKREAGRFQDLADAEQLNKIAELKSKDNKEE